MSRHRAPIDRPRGELLLGLVLVVGMPTAVLLVTLLVEGIRS